MRTVVQMLKGHSGRRSALPSSSAFRERLSLWLQTHPFVGKPLWILRHSNAIYAALVPDLKTRKGDLWWDEELERKRFMRRAFKTLTYNGIDGDYLEFGSHQATTFRMAWSASRAVGHDAHLWAFDSFAGLPESSASEDLHPEWVPGTMATSEEEFHRLCAGAGMSRRHYTTVPGYFSDTLAASPGAKLPSTIALAYVDCDLYSSTLDVMHFLVPRLRHGMVLAFDDYFCYSATDISGERRAVTEVFALLSEWRLEPFLQFGWHGMSFVVERDG